MKKIHLLNLGIIFSLFTACSSDDEPKTSSVPSPYLAGTIDNYWTYDVKANDMESHDSIFISKDTVINQKTYKKVDSKIQPTGFYSNTINKKGIKTQGDEILLSGKTDFGFTEQLPLALDLNDFIIFKENTTANQILSSVSGSVDQTFQTFPIKFEYSLQSQALPEIPSFTSNGITYQNVKPIKILMKGKITTSITISNVTVPVNIMKSQDIISSTLYFVKGIGVVNANTTIQYNLEDFSQLGIELPFPQSFSENVEEFLHSYKNNY